MSNASIRRLMNESRMIDLNREADKSMFEINRVGENMFNWQAKIIGPKESLYDGYKFNVQIKLPYDYPTSPIHLKFITPIAHANVNPDGDICIDILKNEWVSTLNIRTVLISLLSLMSDPNLDDPLNPELAELYRTDQSKYMEQIRNMCEKYAEKIF